MRFLWTGTEVPLLPYHCHCCNFFFFFLNKNSFEEVHYKKNTYVRLNLLWLLYFFFLFFEIEILLKKFSTGRTSLSNWIWFDCITISLSMLYFFIFWNKSSLEEVTQNLVWVHLCLKTFLPPVLVTGCTESTFRCRVQLRWYHSTVGTCLLITLCKQSEQNVANYDVFVFYSPWSQ